MLENDIARKKRRLIILKGISQDLKNSEISAQLGSTRGLIRSDVRFMRCKGDLGLIQAEKTQTQVRETKVLLLTKNKRHLKQNKRFLGMTGITLHEKSFRNMIDFNKHELMKILNSKNQNTAISSLPKSIRKTLKNNGIITDGWHKCEITVKTLDYLFR
ncbi:MAG: hypothetical protein H8E40_06370 [Chloroflexi bacterium]|nr:hypothetical protein [Chloroflexota bacterium]